MKFKDIKQYPRSHYEVHSDWRYLEETLRQWDDKKGITGSLGLNLDPEFQRGHVWTERKQIEFVEYCLMGGESSRVIMFNHPNWQGNYKGEMVLVDGKQRLEAARKFMRNELPIFGGHYLNDFEDKESLLRTSNAHFIFKVFKLQTNKDVMEFYLKLNSGGVVHTQEELNKVKKLIEQEKQENT